VAAEKSDDEPDGAKRSNFGTFADLTKKKKKQ
jgi:hypothetical protein